MTRLENGKAENLVCRTLDYGHDQHACKVDYAVGVPHRYNLPYNNEVVSACDVHLANEVQHDTRARGKTRGLACSGLDWRRRPAVSSARIAAL